MTGGCAIAVAAVLGMNQCAEIARMARGRGTDAPSSRQARVKRLDSSVFIGLPCPMKAAGMRVGVSIRRIVRRPSLPRAARRASDHDEIRRRERRMGADAHDGELD